LSVVVERRLTKEVATMRTLISILAAAVLALASATPVGAITGGAPDGADHPNVGALLGLDRSTGEYFFVCSGSLLGDTEFLTAAHCTPWETIGQTAADVFVSFDPDLHAADPFRWGLFGPVVAPDHVIGLDLGDPKAVMPSFWLPPSGALSHGDVAVLHLAAPASATYPSIESVQLPAPGFLADQALIDGLVGHSFTDVGFGFQNISFKNPTTPTAFNGLRMAATSPFVGLTRDHLTMLQNDRATGEGGICLGDSGGPNFFGARGTPSGALQVSLNVGQGGHGCGTGITASQRLDLPDVLAFLDPWTD
jgi:hypothetical protein